MGMKILLISPVPTHPQYAGNRIRILQLAEHLRAEGCELYFAYYDHEGAGGNFKEMRRFWENKAVFLSERNQNIVFKARKFFNHGLFSRQANDAQKERRTLSAEKKLLDLDVWNNRQFDDSLLKFHSRVGFHMVWVEYVFLSGVLDRFDSNVIKVIDTHDVFTDRHKLFAENQVEPEWFYTSKEMEKKGLCRADYVIAIKDRDAQFFMSLGLPRVITIGHFFPAQTNRMNHHKDADLLFLASDNISNVMAWRYFTEDILERIVQRIPRVSIQVAGRICQRIPDSPFYQKIGTISDLTAIYSSVKVAINPVTFGTGLKIKSIEPLAYGCPVVTTPPGIEGIEDAENQGVLVGKTSDDFAGHLVSLLTEPSRYNEQSEMGHRYFCRYQAQNKQRLNSLLTEVRKRLQISLEDKNP